MLMLLPFCFELARVDGSSMAPTVLHGDRLIVDKLAYRFGAPASGDVVLFRSPVHPDEAYVKRIVARPGDTIVIRSGKVFVNGAPFREPHIPPEFQSHENWGPYPVPDGFYMVLGDHRNRSSDSRAWGPISHRAIIGKIRSCQIDAFCKPTRECRQLPAR
jgi:signal peptidase I